MPAARDEEWSTIAAQAAAGATLVDLAEHWGIPLGTLQARSAREGWKRAAREIQQSKTGIAPCPQHPVQSRATEKGISLMEKLGERSRIRVAKVADRAVQAIGRKKEDALIACTQALKNATDVLKVAHGWGSEAQSSTPLVAIQLNGYVPPEGKS